MFSCITRSTSKTPKSINEFKLWDINFITLISQYNSNISEEIRTLKYTTKINEILSFKIEIKNGLSRENWKNS